MKNGRARSGAAALLFCLAAAAAAQTPIALEVDARDAPRKILHARLTIPVKPGPLTLLYPKWMPGEHSPTGPIADLAGLRLSAGGAAVAWKRDSVDLYAFHLDVPARADQLDVSLDLLSPSGAGQFTSGASMTAQLALISWNQVLLYPAGSVPDETPYAATLRLPAGWKYGTALTTVGGAADPIRFAPVSLTTLVDSPVLAGAHFRTVTLTEGPIPHRLQIAADSEAALAMLPEDIGHYRNLVAETGALFGARHYRHYDFLVTLSDHVAHFGLEHHESSDDRVDERSLVDEDERRGMADLLPHEMAHSWNGKYRRPAGLEPGHFQEPMKGDLLWVYEGLTEYLGWLLAARSGLLTPQQYREHLAATAAGMDAQRGRTWRPLADTATSAQVLFPARQDGAAWRRGTDFYEESELLWLEADTIIRRESGGRKSLDDFFKLFHGGESGPPRVVPYSYADVLDALNRIAPYDWRGFWASRVDATSLHAPMGGIANAGWRVGFGAEPTEMQRSEDAIHRQLDARFSIGVLIEDDGTIPDVIPGSPADRAGIGPGVKLAAVNGRRYNRDVLRDALKASPQEPIELLVENGDFFRSHRLDYSGGERYPRLERDETKPDLLSQILRPLAASQAAGN